MAAVAADRHINLEPEKVKFVIGEKFDSYISLQEKLTNYKNSHFVDFWIRDARTLEAAKKRASSRVVNVNPELRYFEIKFCCIHGGQEFRPKKKKADSHRSATSTFKKGCPAFVSFRLSQNGQHLEVANICETHNHENSNELFKHLPNQRRLPDDLKSRARRLLKMKVDKKMLQQELSEEAGRIITLKDLSNIAHSSKKAKPVKDLNSCVSMLVEKYQAIVHVNKDDEGNFRGLFFQDKDMMANYAAYPEILFVDGTFKLEHLDITVVLMIVKDSNGCSEIVSITLLVSGDVDLLRWMVEMFKFMNSDWQKTRVVMSDRDVQEKNIFREEYPSATHHVCVFQPLRTFKHGVKSAQMGITPAQDMLKNALGELVCDGDTVKSTASRYVAISTFFEQVYIVIRNQRNERDHVAAKVNQRTEIKTFPDGSAESKYFQFLTPYAFRFVFAQMDRISAVTNLQQGEEEVTFSTADKHKSSIDSCECYFHNSMLLPCTHIFRVRTSLELDLYHESLCANRWSKAYYQKAQRLFREEAREEADLKIASPQNLTAYEKKRKASLLASEIASVLSECSDDDFERKLELLKKLLNHWKNREVVTVELLPTEEPELQTECIVQLMEESENVGTGAESEIGPLVTNCSSQPAVLTENMSTKCREIMPKLTEPTQLCFPKKVPRQHHRTNQPVPFVLKPLIEQAEIIMSCFININIVQKALKEEHLILEEEVEKCPEKVANIVLDESIDFNIVLPYFSGGAWLKVESLINYKKVSCQWYCSSCNNDLDDGTSIRCDCCLWWFHLSCVDLKRAPRSVKWFCPSCNGKA